MAALRLIVERDAAGKVTVTQMEKLTKEQKDNAPYVKATL